MGEAKHKEEAELEKKKALFEQNPDAFFDCRECLVVIMPKRDENGKIVRYRMAANIQSEDEAHIAKGRANMAIDTVLMRLMTKKEASGIQVVGKMPDHMNNGR